MKCDVIIVSDLHMDMDTPKEKFITLTSPRDILILVGDVNTGTNASEFILDQLAYGDVIYVLGNHEFYGEIIQKLRLTWNNEISHQINTTAQQRGYTGSFYLLDDSAITLNDITFIGTTLWTNFANRNPLGMLQIRSDINDYKSIYTEGESCITGKNLWVSPDDIADIHTTSLQFIEGELKKDGKKVLLSHYLPSYQSISEKYHGNSLNSSFASNLDYLFYDNDDIILAAHGHTHESINYMINSTPIVCNPRGYINNRNPHFDPSLTIKLGK